MTPTPPRQAFAAQIMDLPITIHLRGPGAHEPAAAGIVAATFDQLRHDADLLNTEDPESPLTRVQEGRDRLSAALPRVRQVAKLCEVAAQRTGRTFATWPPGPVERARFDPTTFVKGWAVDDALAMLVERLTRLGKYDVMINIGGDIAVNCARPDTPGWAIGIADPRDPSSQLLHTVRLRFGAVSTATTGHEVTEGLQSVSIVGSDLAWSRVDAATALAEGEAAAAWIASRPDQLGYLVTVGGQLEEVSKPALRRTA